MAKFDKSGAILSVLLSLVCLSFCRVLTANDVIQISSSDNLAKSAGQGNTSEALEKRWYGVEESPNDNQFAQYHTYPWPQACEGESARPIRYCFKDKRSADRLGPIVTAAIARWAQAIHRSALTIGLDPGANDNPRVYCDDLRISADVLNIEDMSRDGDPDWNQGGECATSTTTGYSYVTKTKPYGPRGRHSMEFCHWIPEWNKASDRAVAVRSMAHELGHAIGLAHEHQRPDRGDHLWFQCANILGYKEAMTLVHNDEKALFEDDSNDAFAENMKLTCNDALYAKQYFPGALDYIRGNHMDDGDGVNDVRWGAFKYDSTFDFDSIMIYSSSSNSNAEGDTSKLKAKQKWVIWNKNGSPVYMGGNQDPSRAQPSEGDIRRVVTLYPKELGARKRDWSMEKWEPLMVKIGGMVTTVLPPMARQTDIW